MVESMAMLGHVSFGISDVERSIAFYDPALAPLGLTPGLDEAGPGWLWRNRSRRSFVAEEAGCAG
jgi:hypothetical protein